MAEEAHVAQEAHEDGGAGRAVHVVVAVDEDGLAVLDGFHEARRGEGHARQERGVVEAAEVGLEEAGGVLDGLYITCGEELPYEGRLACTPR